MKQVLGQGASGPTGGGSRSSEGQLTARSESSRRRVRLNIGIAVVVLAVGLWSFLFQIDKAKLPHSSHSWFLTYPVQLEGLSAGTLGELQFLAEGFEPGREVRVTSVSGAGRSVVLERAHSTLHLIITLVSGLFFIGVSMIVFAPRASTEATRDFYWSTLLYGLTVLIGGVYFTRDLGWGEGVRDLLQIMCLALLPLLFLRLTLYFPRRHRILDRLPWLLPTLWVLAIGVIAWQAVEFARYFAAPGPERARDLALPQIVADVLLVVQVAVACAVLIGRSRRMLLTRERQQTKWLLWGIAVGLTPYVFLRTLPQLLGLAPPLGSQVDRIFELAIPVAFVIAVVRYRFLDIDIIIRRSLIYGILAALLVAIYLIIGIVVGRGMEPTGGGGAWVVLLAFGLVTGLLFMPLKRTIGRWVDQRFFKIHHDYRNVVKKLETRVTQASTQTEVMAELLSCVQGTLDPQPLMGVAIVDDELVPTGADPGDARIAWAAWSDEVLSPAEPVAMPLATGMPELERDDFPTDLSGQGFVLAQPIRAGGHTLGAVFLGLRRTGRRYVELDLQLLVEAAECAGRALDRLGLVQRAAAEALARRQLDELNRLKTDFLDRVAHDLRTPLTSIKWSTENLLDGVLGDLTESQRESFKSVKGSVQLLRRMVDNLLDVSRLDRGGIEIGWETVALGPLIEDVSRTLAFMTDDRRVTINVMQRGEDVFVLGDSTKLFEVVINLLDNAVRYSPSDQTIDVTVGDVGEGRIGFSVRDRGVGLGEVDPGSLFDRYVQGAPSPHSQYHGFGLGLHIVHSYMELMNGRVAAHDHPDGGAVFTCWFTPPTEQEASHEGQRAHRG